MRDGFSCAHVSGLVRKNVSSAGGLMVKVAAVMELKVRVTMHDDGKEGF